MRAQLMATAAVVAFGLSATAAAAQDAASVQIEEVVVTAQRRSENVQKTPLAVSAVTGDKLEAQGVKSVVDLGAQAPSLQITPSGGGAQIFLRGIGSTNVTESGDPAVAYHVDGVYVARPGSIGALFYDIDRVEVVRGPQGTLYGRNATAGAINVITKKPVLGDYQGYGSVEVGNYAAITTQGMVNVPVGETLAVRAAFQTTRHDGYLKSINNGPGTGGNDRYDQDDISARLQVLWKPSDVFSLRVSTDYLHQGGAGGGDINYGYPKAPGYPRACFCTVDISRDNSVFNAGAEASLDLGFGTLTYLTGYNLSTVKGVSENSQMSLPMWTNNKDHTWSNELRLGGDTGALKWVVGLYKFTEDNSIDFRINLGGGVYLGFIQPEVTAESWAAFGQGTYALTDRLRLTAGLRYTEDKKGRTGNTFLLTPQGQPIATVVSNLASAEWNSTNWKVGLDYDLTPSSMAYANIATGYKAGGYFDGVADNTYEPEKITSYEAGVKNRFFDNRLQLNATAFLYDYRDFQVSAIGTIAGQAASITLNADKARIYGLELEGGLALSAHDRIEGNLSRLHAEYTDFVLPLGDSFSNTDSNAALAACMRVDWSTPAPRRADFSGCPMALSPKWSFTLAYQHTWQLAIGGTLAARIQTHYEAGKPLEYHGFTFNHEPSFTKTDLSLTYASADDRWSLQAYVRNLENDEVRTASAPDANTGTGASGYSDFYAPPRLYGLRLGLSF